MLMPAQDPLAEFRIAAERAAAQGVDTVPVALATVGTDARPSIRIVLCKQVDATGFVFHTNYNSRKGRELFSNPHAALCYHWSALEEQIRVEGDVEVLDALESDRYFSERPRGSQIGAWASEQSADLLERGVLEGRVREFEQRFAGQAVPRPPFWGGYRLVPSRVEFWKGRADRLHDRTVYMRSGDGWRVVHLYP